VGLVRYSSSYFPGPSNITEQGIFQGWDTNVYDNIYGVFIFLICLDIILELSGMVWGIYKLYDRYQTEHFTLNIATVCLSLETSGCLLRAISHILFLIITVVPYVPITANTPTAFYYLGFPFTLSSGIFLIFFWIDVTSRSLYHGAFLDKAFWPALSLVVISFAIVFISVVLLLLGRSDTFAGGSTVVILILLFVISIIYFIAAYKVNKYMSGRKDSDPVREKDFKKMTIKIVISGAEMILMLCFIIAIQYLARVDWMNYILQRILYTLFPLRSYILIDLFSSPTKALSRSTQSQPATNSTTEV